MTSPANTDDQIKEIIAKFKLFFPESQNPLQLRNPDFLNLAREAYTHPNHQEAIAAKYFTLAFSLKPNSLNNKDLIHFAHCSYVSGVYYEHIQNLEKYLTLEDSDNITFWFYLASNNQEETSKRLNTMSDFPTIDTRMKLVSAIYYLADNKEYEKAIQLLTIYKSLLSEVEFRLHLKDFNAMLRTELQILCDETSYKIRYFKQKENQSYKQLIITFDPIDAHKRNEPYGISVSISAGFDVIHVAQASRTNYQGLSFDTFKEITLSITTLYEDVLCYGSSLGGYAALYYSGAINSRVLALSPLNSFDHIFPQLDIMSYQYSHMSFFKVPKTEKDVFISYDLFESKDEIYFNAYIRKYYSDASYLFIPHAGHPVTTYFSNKKLLKEILFNIINKNKWGINLDEDIENYEEITSKWLNSIPKFKKEEDLSNKHLKTEPYQETPVELDTNPNGIRFIHRILTAITKFLKKIWGSS